MCSPTNGNSKNPVSVHAIERFVQWRLRIKESELSYFGFFLSPEDIVDVQQKIEIVAYENYFRRMIELERYNEVLIAFDRFYKRKRLLCLSTVAIIILGLLHSPLTVVLPDQAELYLKSLYTTRPRLEADVKYYRIDNIIFVASSATVITGFILEPHDREIIDAIMYGKPIQLFY